MIYNNDEVLKQQIIGEEYFFFFFFFSIYKRIAEKEKKFQYMFRLENYSIYEKKKNQNKKSSLEFNRIDRKSRKGEETGFGSRKVIRIDGKILRNWSRWSTIKFLK